MSHATDLRPDATAIVVRSKLDIRRSHKKYGGTGDPDHTGPLPDLSSRAAQYVRMSTEHQRYSTANQRDAIAAYAKEHGLEIVRTYADDGRSGLDIQGRPALRQLLEDVASGSAGFGLVLVYDVSRWGRFQDTDESACYEFLCRRAGIRVEYCAEQFSNDGTPIAAVFKSLKRIMAGEYSRELSVKVFAGKCRGIRLGFHQGSVAPYGLRRMVVDEKGRPRGLLRFGQQKFAQSDRVVLVPGPPKELKVLAWIFEQVALRGRGMQFITDSLNRRGVPAGHRRAWTQQRIACMLVNEKYIGNLVYNRTSCKLRTRIVRNAPEQWLRSEGVFAPAVDPDLFRKAQEVMAAWTPRITNDAALELLRALYLRHGRLSAALINNTPGMPGSVFYENRFGGLVRTYAHVGYVPNRDYGFLDGFTVRLRRVAELREDIARRFRGRGAPAQACRGAVVALDAGPRLGVALGRYKPRPGGQPRWQAQIQPRPRPNAVLVARLSPSDGSIMDYFLFWDRCGSIVLEGRHYWNGVERYRSDTLDPLLDQFLARGPCAALVPDAAAAAARCRAHADPGAALQGLRSLFLREGRLTEKTIDGAEGLPGSWYYRQQFGSLTRAYEMVGYRPELHARWAAHRRQRADLGREVAKRLTARGAAVACGRGALLAVNGLRLAVVVARRRTVPPGRWFAPVNARPLPDAVLVARPADEGNAIREFVLVWGCGASVTLDARCLRRGRRRSSAVRLEPLIREILARSRRPHGVGPE